MNTFAAGELLGDINLSFTIGMLNRSSGGINRLAIKAA